MVKTKELLGMSDEQLGLTLRDIEKHLFQLRFQSATNRLQSPAEIRKAKRDIARIRTVQRARELAKLRELPPDQLASRIAALEAKVKNAVPGKRVAYRQAKRLKKFYAEKTTRPHANPGAGGPKGSGK
jgi:large subunit ribosomal protein L29